MATHRRGRPFNYGRPIPLHRLQEYNSWVELPDDPINDPPSSQNERRLSPDLVDDIAADFLPPPESQAQATPRRRPQRSGQPSSPSPSDPADVPHPATSFRPGRLRRVRGRMEDSDIGSISSPVLSDVESPEIPAMSGLGEQGVESRGRTEGTATNVASGTTGGQTEDIQRTLEAGTGSASAASGVHPATAGGTPDPTRPAADAPQQAAAQTEGGDSMAGPTPHATGSVGPVTTSTQLAPDIAHGVSATSREAIDVGGQAATAPGATDQTAPSARQGLGQAAGALTNTGQAIGTGAQAATTPGDTGGDEDEKEEDPFEIPFDYDEAYDQGLMDVLPPLELGTDYDDGRSQTKYRILLENNYVLFAWWLYRRTVEKHGGDKGEAIYQQPYDMVYHWICILYSMHPKLVQCLNSRTVVHDVLYHPRDVVLLPKQAPVLLNFQSHEQGNQKWKHSPWRSDQGGGSQYGRYEAPRPAIYCHSHVNTQTGYPPTKAEYQEIIRVIRQYIKGVQPPMEQMRDHKVKEWRNLTVYPRYQSPALVDNEKLAKDIDLTVRKGISSSTQLPWHKQYGGPWNHDDHLKGRRRYIRNLTNLVDLGKILNRTEEILDKLTQSHHPIPWSLMGVGWSAEPKTRAASHAAHDPGSLYLMNLFDAVGQYLTRTGGINPYPAGSDYEMKNVILYDLWDNGQSRPGEHLLSEIGHSYTWRLGFNGTPAGRSNATAEKVTMGRYQENFERLDHHRISDLIGKHNTHREQLTKYINAVEKSQQNTKDDKSRQAKMTKSVEQKQQAEGKTYDGEMEVATAYRKLGRQHNLDCDLLADAHELSAAARNLKDLVDALRGLANLGLEEEEL